MSTTSTAPCFLIELPNFPVQCHYARSLFLVSYMLSISIRQDREKFWHCFDVVRLSNVGKHRLYPSLQPMLTAHVTIATYRQLGFWKCFTDHGEVTKTNVLSPSSISEKHLFCDPLPWRAHMKAACGAAPYLAHGLFPPSTRSALSVRVRAASMSRAVWVWLRWQSSSSGF